MALKTFKPVTPGLRQLVIVDRKEGGHEYLEERGMRLLSVLTSARFLAEK